MAADAIQMISGENEEEKVGFFIAKVPAQSTEDRQLASMASVDHREILFYTKTAPDIMVNHWKNLKEILFVIMFFGRLVHRNGSNIRILTLSLAWHNVTMLSITVH